MFRNPYLYLYAFGSFSNGLFISLRGPIIPELARRVGVESAALGTYLGIGGISGGVFAVPTGMLLDRFDPHAVFVSGVLLRAASVGALPACTALWQVNALAAVQGATLPLIGVSIRVCLVRAVGGARCAKALNFTMGAFGLASILSPLAYAALTNAFGFTRGFDLTFVCASVAYLALAALVPFFRTPAPEPEEADESTPPPARRGASRTHDGVRTDSAVSDGARDGLRASDGGGAWRHLGFGRSGSGFFAPGAPDAVGDRAEGDADAASRPGIEAIRAGVTLAPPRRPVRRRLILDEEEEASDGEGGLLFSAAERGDAGGDETRDASVSAASASASAPAAVLIPMVMYMALSVAVEVTYASWIYTLAMRRGGFDENAAAFVTSAFWAAFTATRFLLSLLDAEPLTVVLGSHGVAFVATSLLAAHWGGVLPWGLREDPGAYSSPPSVAAIWVATLVAGAGSAGMFPNGIALGRKMFPLAGTTQALFELGAATGAGAGPFLAAAAYKKCRDSAAVPAACAVAGAGAVAAVAVALRANESRKRRDAGGGVGGAKYREGGRGGEALRERLLPDANEEDPA